MHFKVKDLFTYVDPKPEEKIFYGYRVFTFALIFACQSAWKIILRQTFTFGFVFIAKNDTRYTIQYLSCLITQQHQKRVIFHVLPFLSQ